MTNFDLTENELAASLILVGYCLSGMGGERPSDLDSDPYTWVDAKELMANGWNKNEAAGTFGALIEKGMICQESKTEWALTTAGYQFLDTVWDENMEGCTKPVAKLAPVATANPVTGELTKKARVAALIHDEGTTIMTITRVLGVSKGAAASLIQDLRHDGMLITCSKGVYRGYSPE